MEKGLSIKKEMKDWKKIPANVISLYIKENKQKNYSNYNCFTTYSFDINYYQFY